MQIHELSSHPRQTDEGVLSTLGAVGKSAGMALKQAVSPGLGTTQNISSASAGILDPKQKLAAVMKEPAMVKLATQYAKEWLKDPRSQVQAQAVPEAVATAPAAKTATSKPVPAAKTATGKPAAPTVGATGFNYNNTMKLPGMEKYAAGAQPQPNTTTNATSSRINKADPNNPNIKDQNKYVQGRTGSGPGGEATKFAKYDPATSAMANANQGINNMVKGGVAARQPAATTPAKFTGTAMPLKPFQVPGAGTDPTPTNPIGYNVAAKPSAVAVKYLKDFLAFANEKIAMRDSATYKMLGLTDAEKSDLKSELDAAKKAVVAAQGKPADTEAAVKNYILTAMSALQLVASQNTVKAASPEAPAYGQQPASGQPGAVGTAPVTGQITGSNAVKLLTDVGLTTQLLTTAGQKIQAATGKRQLSKTGDSVIDTMLQGMGYTVS